MKQRYSLSEELFNSISHGIGAFLSIIALIMLVVKSHGLLAEITVTLFGISMIVLYTISCIYHALSYKLKGKQVLRIIDHCNVFLLVFGTFIPASLLGIRGTIGWILFGIVAFFTLIGIIFTAINMEKYIVVSVFSHLICGWLGLIAVPELIHNMGHMGLLFLILGGIMYTIGSILYGIGKKIKYMHSVFHIFCLLGTLFHFICIYFYLL